MKKIELFLQYKKMSEVNRKLSKPRKIKKNNNENNSESIEIKIDSEKENNQEKGCIHENKITENGSCICMDCGEEIDQIHDTENTWMNCGRVDTKQISDPNRVQQRKLEEKTIYKDVENFGIAENIVAKANKLYADVSQGQIFRGNSRKSIIFACIFFAYKMSNLPQSHDKLISMFGLSKKVGLKGLKHVTLKSPDRTNLHSFYITPVNLVDDIMEKFQADKKQKEEVLKLYEKIHNKSSRLNRSRPQSIAAALVYYWICLNNKKVTLKNFAEIVKLSELTITKILKEIKTVLETN